MSSSDVRGVKVVDDVVEVLGVLARRCANLPDTSSQWQQCQAVQHPDEVLGDVIRVVQGVQPQILPPPDLAKVEEAALHVHLLPKHGRHSLHRRHLEVGDDRGWVGVEAERRARVGDGLQHLGVHSLISTW